MAPDASADAVLPRLLADDGAQSGLRDALVALTAQPAPGEQPGEAAALAAFRELVAEPAGIPSLAHRRRLRTAAVAASSVVIVLSGGVAAAASGALPGPAQDAARTVLGVVGVHVPSSAGSHQAPGDAGSPTPTATTPAGFVPPAFVPEAPPSPSASHPSHPAHPSTPPTPGNSGQSRHHGNPTPTASGHPSPGHGKPSSPPITSHRKSPNPHASNSSSQAVMHRSLRAVKD